MPTEVTSLEVWVVWAFGLFLAWLLGRVRFRKREDAELSGAFAEIAALKEKDGLVREERDDAQDEAAKLEDQLGSVPSERNQLETQVAALKSVHETLEDNILEAVGVERGIGTTNVTAVVKAKFAEAAANIRAASEMRTAQLSETAKHVAEIKSLREAVNERDLICADLRRDLREERVEREDANKRCADLRTRLRDYELVDNDTGQIPAPTPGASPGSQEPHS